MPEKLSFTRAQRGSRVRLTILRAKLSSSIQAGRSPNVPPKNTDMLCLPSFAKCMYADRLPIFNAFERGKQWFTPKAVCGNNGRKAQSARARAVDDRPAGILPQGRPRAVDHAQTPGKGNAGLCPD